MTEYLIVSFHIAVSRGFCEALGIKASIEVFILIKPFVFDVTVVSPIFKPWVDVKFAVNTIELFINVLRVFELTVSSILDYIEPNLVKALVPFIQLRDQWEERDAKVFIQCVTGCNIAPLKLGV